jgi:hypothetical protein
MQTTGQVSEKRSYRVILLLVLGLAAFSSAMKELNQVQDLTLQTSKLIAELSDAIAPADHNSTLVKVETCENNGFLLPPPPPLPVVPPAQVDVTEAEPPAVPLPPAVPKVRQVPVARPKIVVLPEHDSVEVRVLPTDELIEKSIKEAFESDATVKALKAKNRRHIFIGPDGRDVILKTLNRSINLRSAS